MVESVNLLVNSNGTVVRSEVVGALKMRTFLSGMPECKLGLNDKVQSLLAITTALVPEDRSLCQPVLTQWYHCNQHAVFGSQCIVPATGVLPTSESHCAIFCSADAVLAI